MSKTEQIHEAIKGLLVTVPIAKVERNTAVPEKIPTGGLIVLRDGDPGEPETALGGFGGIYYSHGIEIELYIEDGDATARDAAFDALVQAIGTALEADPSHGPTTFAPLDSCQRLGGGGNRDRLLPRTHRVMIALRTVRTSNIPELSAWADGLLTNRVDPIVKDAVTRFRTALSPHSPIYQDRCRWEYDHEPVQQ